MQSVSTQLLRLFGAQDYGLMQDFGSRAEVEGFDDWDLQQLLVGSGAVLKTFHLR